MKVSNRKRILSMDYNMINYLCSIAQSGHTCYHLYFQSHTESIVQTSLSCYQLTKTKTNFTSD